eukprot:TRINITY_DN2777_c0_g1_i2.p2 TRINITY_DN2777_c0_g1~~TRINITY_DN2777_c0_g1_i2.p2  ORF type:complete len:245 (-),score=86.16 TRINITY_DN2777_c0_g1_i2:1139-1873(-)
MGKAYPSMPEFTALKQKVQKLEERVYSHDNKFAEHQTIIDTTNFNVQMMQMTVNEHDEKIEERSYFHNKIVMKMKEQLDAMQKALEDLTKLVNAKTQVIRKDSGRKSKVETVISDPKDYIGSLERLREELLESLASKDDLNLLAKRIESLESLTSDLNKEQEKTNKEIEAINERLKALEKQLLDKVGCDQYDSLLALINQLKSPGDGKEVQPIGPIISSKDVNLIKEIASKFSDLETRVNTLSK